MNIKQFLLLIFVFTQVTAMQQPGITKYSVGNTIEYKDHYSGAYAKFWSAQNKYYGKAGRLFNKLFPNTPHILFEGSFSEEGEPIEPILTNDEARILYEYLKEQYELQEELKPFKDLKKEKII